MIPSLGPRLKRSPAPAPDRLERPANRPPGRRAVVSAPVSGSGAPTGMRCRGWPQEAALRMLENNLHPDVAERPADLVVYGGTGRAARDHAAYRTIRRELMRLGDDETLLVQSGKPVGLFRTHDDAPRVLIANSNLVP